MTEQDDFFKEIGMKPEPKEADYYPDPVPPFDPATEIIEPKIPGMMRYSDLLNVAKKYLETEEARTQSAENAAFFALSGKKHNQTDIKDMINVIISLRTEKEKEQRYRDSRPDIYD